MCSTPGIGSGDGTGRWIIEGMMFGGLIHVDAAVTYDVQHHRRSRRDVAEQGPGAGSVTISNPHVEPSDIDVYDDDGKSLMKCVGKDAIGQIVIAVLETFETQIDDVREHEMELSVTGGRYAGRSRQ